MKVIFLNGPPYSGKDSCATALQTRFTGVACMKMSDPVKSATHAAFGLNYGINHYEKIKDISNDDFFGYTPRQCYINHSEKYMKPLYGKDIFGKLFARRVDYIQYQQKRTILVADSGFTEESMPAINKLGAENCCLIRIHRPGYDYSFDSRSYLYLDVGLVIDLQNNSTLEVLAERIIHVYEAFMNGHAVTV